MANKKESKKAQLVKAEPKKKPNDSVKKNSKNKTKKNKTQIIYPDGWAVVEVDDDKFLTFYQNDEPVLQLELDEEVMKDIMEELNMHIVIDENMADAWTYRRPLDKTLPDFLTLMAKGKILATLPVDRKIAQKLMPQMEHYAEPVSFFKRLDKMRQRSIMRFILSSIFILIVLGVIIYSGYQWVAANYVEVGKQLITG